MVYSAYLGGDEIGTVTLKKNGLYYHIDGRCRLSGQVICCLIAQTQTNRINLGTMIPDNGYFRLKSRIAIKKLGEGSLHFIVEPKHPEKDTLFIPLRADEPFTYLQRLSNAYLACRDDIIGIEFQEEQHQSTISNPTGQWSEPNVSE